MDKPLIHYFLKENVNLSGGGHGYKEISLCISDEKITICDITDDIHSDGFEYEYNRTITIESKYFENYIECINSQYNTKLKLDGYNIGKELTNINQRIIFKSIYLAYKDGGIEKITDILDNGKIKYENHIYSRQDTID
jgi:hypothetical protein